MKRAPALPLKCPTAASRSPLPRASRTRPVSRQPRRARRVPARVGPTTGPSATRDGCRHGCGRGEGSGERAREPPSKKSWTRSVPDPSRPEVRPSEEGRGILSFFRIHGRDLTSASDGVGDIPPHSLAFRPECNPSTTTALRVTPIPWARRRRASEGTESLSKAMGSTWRSLTPRGEWLPPKRNTAGVASRKMVTGSDNSRCAITRV